MRIIKRAKKLNEDGVYSAVQFGKNTGLFMYAGKILCLQSRIELRTGSTQEDLCSEIHAIRSSDV